MCFGSKGKSSALGDTPKVTPDTYAIEAAKAYRKTRIDQLNAYNGDDTDLIGSLITRNKATGPTSQLKALMGG